MTVTPVSDPCVGNLATPVNSSYFTKSFLNALPAYRPSLSPNRRGLEVGQDRPIPQCSLVPATVVRCGVGGLRDTYGLEYDDGDIEVGPFLLPRGARDSLICFLFFRNSTGGRPPAAHRGRRRSSRRQPPGAPPAFGLRDQGHHDPTLPGPPQAGPRAHGGPRDGPARAHPPWRRLDFVGPRHAVSPTSHTPALYPRESHLASPCFTLPG